jgi:hypothetical protein
MAYFNFTAYWVFDVTLNMPHLTSFECDVTWCLQAGEVAQKREPLLGNRLVYMSLWSPIYTHLISLIHFFHSKESRLQL